jgi:hypothetical protein
MSRCHRIALTAAVLTVALVASGCTGGGTTATSGPSATSPTAEKSAPAAFQVDESAAKPLDVTAAGGHASVRSGEATAGVYVPAGAASAGSAWKLIPLTSAPSGVKKPLCPGVYVDVAGKEPSKPCLIGFALLGDAPTDATIVKISDDGSSSKVVATDRTKINGMTLLVAEADGFSAYTTAEEDAAARDQALQDRAKAKGQQVDWTIKAGGKETQKKEGWTFNYELDLFASGGGVGQGGVYKGHSSLSVDGTYKGPVSIVKSFGKLSGIGRDKNLTFTIVDPNLGFLVSPEGDYDPDRGPVDGMGSMTLDGMGSLDMAATAPNVSGKYSKKNVKGSGATPFTIVIKGEDVQVEIPNVGIFPGKILRTTK